MDIGGKLFFFFTDLIIKPFSTMNQEMKLVFWKIFLEVLSLKHNHCQRLFTVALYMFIKFA